MERGYVKLWRKVRDSRSHSRGVLHRALIETFLVEANWKKGYFCGQEIGPGQLAVSVLGLAKELKVSRTTLQRAIKDLVADEFITVTNMGNRWTMITLINWDTYQNNENQNGQQMGNKRATDGQPAGIIKELKKERIKEEDNKYFCAELDKPAHTQEAEPAVISLPLVSGGMHHITQANIDRWKELFPGVDVMNELRRMLAWLEANPRQRKTPRGIARFIQGWLDREQNRARAPHASPETPRKTWAEMEEERSRAEFLRMTGGAANG